MKMTKKIVKKYKKICWLHCKKQVTLVIFFKKLILRVIIYLMIAIKQMKNKSQHLSISAT